MMNTNQSKTHADNIYSPDNSTTATPTLQSMYNPPRHRGEVGWICPVCGRGNAPSTAYCNCNMTKPEIVYANGGLTMKSVLDAAIPCKYSDSATSISSNSTEKGFVYGAHYDMHN